MGAPGRTEVGDLTQQPGGLPAGISITESLSVQTGKIALVLDTEHI